MPEIRVCISWYYVFLRESILWHCQPAQTLVQQLCSAWTLQLILPLTTGLLWPFYFTFNFSDLLYLIVSSLLLFCFFEMISSAWNIWKRDRPREGAIPRIGHGRFDPTKTYQVHWSFIRGWLSCKSTWQISELRRPGSTFALILILPPDTELLHFPKIHRNVFHKINNNRSIVFLRHSWRQSVGKHSAEVRLIHAEQISFIVLWYNFIIFRKINSLSWRLNKSSKTF